MLGSLDTKANETTPEQQTPFPQCITNLQTRAETAGVSAERIENVLGQAKHLDKIISYDRNQPEFVKTFPNSVSYTHLTLPTIYSV